MEGRKVHHQLPGRAPLGRIIHDQQGSFLGEHCIQIRLQQMFCKQRAADRIGRNTLDAGAHLAALLKIWTVQHNLLDHFQSFKCGADDQSHFTDASCEVLKPRTVPFVQTPEREDESLLVLREFDRCYTREALHTERAAFGNDVRGVVGGNRKLEGERHNASVHHELRIIGVYNTSIVLSRLVRAALAMTFVGCSVDI